MARVRKDIIKLFLIVVIALFCEIKVCAENFYIENYDVDIKVNKNKSIFITEDIDVYFTRESHGIIRKIPYKNASISSLGVENETFRITRTNSTVAIKIGDADRYISGRKHYRITYRYNYHDNKNEFYHNIIGTEWGVPINRATFKIMMPEKFDKDKSGISIGKYGTKGFDGGAEYRIEDNIIAGETHRVLEPYEGITFRVEVSKGYFNRYINGGVIILTCILLLLTSISFFTWFRYGKDEHITPVVAFGLPKGVNNVLEADAFYNGKPTNTGLVALIIELANKGYVRIENKNRGDFTIWKVKDFDSNSNKQDEIYCEEQKLLDALFPMGVKGVSKKYLSKSPSFYRCCQAILKDVKDIFDVRIYERDSVSSKLNRIMLWCILGIICCFLLFATGIQFSPFLSNIGATLCLFSLFCFRKWSKIVFIGSLFVVPMFLTMGNFTNEYLIQMKLCIPCFIVAVICAVNLPKRNKKSSHILGELRGLKHYIIVAEKNQLKQLANDNPEQFYNILPYAYILGVSNIWIIKFMDIMEFKPDLYDPVYIPKFTKTMKSYTVSPYANGGRGSSSGGFHSSSGGGGFSGGGGGGGGGSSW